MGVRGMAPVGEKVISTSMRIWTAWTNSEAQQVSASQASQVITTAAPGVSAGTHPLNPCRLSTSSISQPHAMLPAEGSTPSWLHTASQPYHGLHGIVSGARPSAASATDCITNCFRIPLTGFPTNEISGTFCITVLYVTVNGTSRGSLSL